MTGEDIKEIPSTHQYEEANSGTGQNPMQPLEQVKNGSGADGGTADNQNDTKETAALAVNTDNEQNVDHRQTGTKAVDANDTDIKGANETNTDTKPTKRNAKNKTEGTFKKPRLNVHLFSFPGPSRESHLPDANPKKSTAHPRQPLESSHANHKASSSTNKHASTSNNVTPTSSSRPHTYHAHRSSGSVHLRSKEAHHHPHYQHHQNPYHYRYLNSGLHGLPSSNAEPGMLLHTPTGSSPAVAEHSQLSPMSLSEISTFVKLTAASMPTPESLKPSQASEIYSSIATAQYFGSTAGHNNPTSRPASSTNSILQNTPGLNNVPRTSSSSNRLLQNGTGASIVDITTSNAVSSSPVNSNNGSKSDTNFKKYIPASTNEHLVTAFPHIVRPVPVFVADQLTQSRKTTIASYLASSDTAASPTTSTNKPYAPLLSQPASLPSSFGAVKNSNDDSPSGASTAGRHLVSNDLEIKSDAGDSNSSVTSLPYSGTGVSPTSNAMPNSIPAHLQQDGQTSFSPFNTNNSVQQTSALFTLPTGPGKSNLNSTAASYANQPTDNVYLPGPSNNHTYLLVKSVIAEKQKQLKASSSASRWAPFVAATMPLQPPQATALPELDSNTRIKPEDLDAQFSLDGDWAGGANDAKSHKPMGSFLKMFNYIMCCFMNVNEEGGRANRYYDEESDSPGSQAGIYRGQSDKGTGAWSGNDNLYRRNDKPKYNEKYGYPNIPGGNRDQSLLLHQDSSSSSSSSDSNEHSHNPILLHPNYGQYGRNVRHYMSRKKRKWQPKIFYVLLNNPLIPLTLRLFNFVLSIAGLALACSIFIKSKHLSITQQPSTVMAIAVQTCALAYLVPISYDEYSGKPLGLRDFKSKVRLIMLDLLFIIFASANLSLAFNTLFDPMWICQDGGYITVTNPSHAKLDPSLSDPIICRRQRSLVSFLLVILASWIITFTLSIFRLIERIAVM